MRTYNDIPALLSGSGINLAPFPDLSGGTYLYTPKRSSASSDLLLMNANKPYVLFYGI